MATNDMHNDSDDAWLTDGRAVLASLNLAPQAESVGRVEHIADGIARVSGLPNVRLNELLQFGDG
ncbi:F0F1 ATP synthase subunit alpha, partial [Burkholderia sp. SIMBA_052]